MEQLTNKGKERIKHAHQVVGALSELEETKSKRKSFLLFSSSLPRKLLLLLRVATGDNSNSRGLRKLRQRPVQPARLRLSQSKHFASLLFFSFQEPEEANERDRRKNTRLNLCF